jgi:starch phosphorylase
MDEAKNSETAPEHLAEYGCGPVQFSGNIDALFERHLRFDDIVDPAAAGARQKFEAAAHAVRDVLSQRWIETQQTYDRENPKRIYYLSMEFLIGRSLTNNVTNLTLHPFVERADRDGALDWFGLVEQEPDAGLGNGGLGRLAACFLDSMATMQLPAMGYGLRYEYGMFRQSIENGWQREHPDNWLRRRDPWEVVRSGEVVEVKFGCSFELHQETLQVVPNRPSSLIGIPYDRPVVGSAARPSTACGSGARPRMTISTSRNSAPVISLARWSAVSRPIPSLACCIRTIPLKGDKGCGSRKNISWSPARWRT